MERFFCAGQRAPDFFTHLLDMGVISLNGRWEPLLQMTVNAFIHAAFVCALAFCLWDFLGRKNGWLVCFLLAPFTRCLTRRKTPSGRSTRSNIS